MIAQSKILKIILVVIILVTIFLAQIQLKIISKP